MSQHTLAIKKLMHECLDLFYFLFHIVHCSTNYFKKEIDDAPFISLVFAHWRGD